MEELLRRNSFVRLNILLIKSCQGFIFLICKKGAQIRLFASSINPNFEYINCVECNSSIF